MGWWLEHDGKIMKTRLIHTTDEADALMAELSKSADHAVEQLQDLIQHQGGLQVLENIKFGASVVIPWIPQGP